MNAITCLAWVKRGVAKQHPDQIKLDEDELKNIITRQRTPGNDGEDDAEEEPGTLNEGDRDEDIAERYGLDDYDDEVGDDDDDSDWVDDDDGDEEEEGVQGNPLNFGGIPFYASSREDPYLIGDDSDEEELEVTPEDNMIVAGKVHGDFCEMDIYVYNENDSNLYVHHDIMLPYFPLCLEWLNYDPGEPTPGNMVALGSMSPNIEIWDLDVINAVEPAFVLAGTEKKSRKKKKRKVHSGGHTDAVLDLSWNENQPKVLSSASADFTIGLWDLEQGSMVTSIAQHTEKVQSLQWHPFEPQTLLSGSFDKTCKVFDCRSPDASHKSWDLPGEVERVLWNHHNPYYFFASTDTGHVYCLDVRTTNPVYTLKAHHKSVTGLTLSKDLDGCLITCSQDGSAKVWDIRNHKPCLVFENDVKIGELQCVQASPDSALIYACGGERELRVINLQRNPAVCDCFGVTCTKPRYSKQTGKLDDSGLDDLSMVRANESEEESEEEATKMEAKQKSKKKKKRKEAATVSTGQMVNKKKKQKKKEKSTDCDLR